MNTGDLQHTLQKLWQQGLELWLEDEQLRFKGNKQLLSSEVMSTLRDNKNAIVTILQQTPDAFLGFPLSHGQRGIYLMQNMAKDSAIYNQSCLLRLASSVDSAILEASINDLLQRHPILGASFAHKHHTIAQATDQPHTLTLAQHSIAATDFNNFVQQQAEKHFDLSQAPLLRAQLINSSGSLYLLLVVHHLAADFWAMQRLIKELELIYTAMLAEQAPVLPALNKSYKDYVLYEQSYLQSEQGLADKNYWHTQLTPLPPTLQLPQDFTPPAQASFNGQELHFTLSKELNQHLKEQAKAWQVTPFVWLLSCYQLLMHRYSGENDITVGTPIANRLQQDFQHMAGHFTNPVVLRTQFADITLFKDLLAHNKQQVLLAMKHQQYPLQLLVEELKVNHDLHSTPLFQVAISWNQLVDSADKSGSLIEGVEQMTQHGAMYAMVLSCYDSGDDIEIAWRFNSDIYKPSTIARYQEHLTNCLKNSLEQPEQNYQAVSFLSCAEKQLYHQINRTDAKIPRNINVATLFKSSCEAYGERIAFRDIQANKNYSYNELDAYSNQIAHYFQAQGLQAGDIVALCIGRAYDMIACLLATVKSGIIYIPVDADNPKDRIASIMQSSQAKALVSPSTHTLNGKLDAIFIALDSAKDTIAQQSTTFDIYQQGHVDDDATACIFYTSGSTGEPKGVEIPHRAIVRLVSNTNFADFNTDDRFLHICNIAFDASNVEIWSTLASGASLLYIDNESLLNPAEFERIVATEKPTATVMTTALFNLFIQHKAAIFKDFRYVMFGGEAADKHSCNACITHGKPEHLLNVYGPTENGTYSTVYLIDELQDTQIPIGFVVSNSQAYVFDQHDQLAPIGVIGELVVGGDGVSTGYRNQPELTAGVFMPDYFRGKGQLYRTGDLAWLREDGMMMYAGRTDDQIKLRGFRIETQEIEQKILQFTGIEQCHVDLVKTENNAYLAAWFTAIQTIDTQALKSQLQQNLPSFMQPSALMQLDELPLSANGKIDRRALPTPAFSSDTMYVAASSDLEKQVLKLWQQLFALEKIGIHDSFFDLGGNSLLAAKLSSLIEQELAINIGMRSIFEYPDIASLSQFIAQEKQSLLPPIIAQHSDEPVPASLSQQRLWFLQQLDSQSTVYNMPLALLLKKAIKPKAIEQAIYTLIQRHDVLHSYFADKEGEAWLHKDKNPEWHLSQLDFSQLTAPARNQALQKQMAMMSEEVFDLQQAPVLKAVLIQLDNQQQALILCLHHIMIDGVSVHLLLQEFAALLKGETLPEVELQYSDFSLWQHQWLNKQALKDQLSYWQQNLGDCPALLELPTDKARPAILSGAGAEHLFNIDKHTVDKLRALAKDNNASLFMLMLAAFAVLLKNYSQQEDVCIGFPIAGRKQNALQNLVGLFVNNLVIRSQFDDNTRIIEHIANVRQSTLDALSNQDVPFDSLIDALKLERSLSYTPFLQVSFALEEQSFAERIQDTLGDTAELLPMDWHVAKYDINLSCYEQKNGEIQASLEYSTDLYTADSMQRMGKHYVKTLHDMLDNPDALVNQLSLLSDDEQQEAIAELAHKKLLPEPEQPIELFEKNALRFAQNTALSFENSTISYAELNKLSNQLARVLENQGIKGGDFVGLFLDRSNNMVASILALFKLGAAYIPLDPNSPPERVRYIVEDAGIQHIISEEKTASALDTASLLLEDLLQAAQAENSSNLNKVLSLDSNAYVIYTSGTTGNPKGCVVSQRNIARLLSSSEPVYQFNDKDIWTLFHSYAFDISVWEMWGAFLYGGKLIVIPYWLSRSSDAFYQLLAEEKVTVLNQTPSAFSQLITSAHTQPRDLALRYVIFGGEALDFISLKQWVKHHPLEQTALVNMYGITETTVHSTHHKVTNEELNQSRSNIGRALDDLHIWLLDKQQGLMSDGLIGEMYISGPGVTLGYLHRPELTAERFIANPFAHLLPKAVAEQHAVLYRSGDLAKRMSNGDYEYLGRCDQQVKIRGHRIELGEVEATLNQMDNVQESVVRASADNQQLYAWLLAKDGQAPDINSLRRQLQAHLPDYMIPGAFMVLPQWPLTGNGKINISQLPQPSADAARAEYVAPRNDTEETLAALWAEVLEIDKVGIHDNFFDLGGHSLLATKLAARIRNTLQCQLELRLLFENPTIEELSLLILEQELNALDIDADELESLLEQYQDDAL